MFRWFVRLLYDSTLAKFRSAYGLAESVGRLSAATKRWPLFNFGNTMAVGRVSTDSVRLRRVIPMVHNSFQPVFTGLLLGLSVCWPLFAMPAHADPGLPTGIEVVFAVFSCVVVAIWGRWWYAQRMHFIWS